MTFNDVRFAQRFPQSSHPRGSSFPFDDLFDVIERELAAKRYVIVSLATPPHYHNYVIYNRLPNGEFEAVTKGRDPKNISNVKEQVHNMGGTDILA